MSISSTSRRAGPFFGNGVATDFSFDFKLFKPEELRVVRLLGASNAEVDLVMGVDYDAILNADQDENPGGGVTLRAPLAVGDRLTLVSAVPELQPVDITNQGGFYPDLLNGGLDRATILVQQLKDESDRAIKLPVSSTPADLTLPLPQGNQLLTWNGDGTALVNRDPGELISVVTYGNTKADIFDGDGATRNFTLTASPGSVNNMQIAINGVMQVPGQDYTWGGGKALAFAVAPPAGTKVFVRYQEALDEGTDVSGKADKNGGNINPAEGEQFREKIEASPAKVLTFTDGFEPVPATQYREVTDKLRDTINARDAILFDAVKDIDAKVSLEALFADRAKDGGVAILPPGQIKISSLTIPAGVKVSGAGTRPGEEQDKRNYARLGTVLWLDPAGTITLENMAQLENVTILNPKLRYVTVTNGVPDCTEAQIMGTAPYTTGPFAGQLAGVGQFSGKAITCRGDDTRVKDCLVIGFDYAYFSSGWGGPVPNGLAPGPSRQHVNGLWFDCTNGIDISNCWDVAQVHHNEGFAFFVAHTGFSWAAILRDGIAYNFHDHVDGAQLSFNFDIGHNIGYRFKDIFGIQVVSCTSDGASTNDIADTSRGFVTEGTISGLWLNNVQGDAHYANFEFKHTAGMVGGGVIQSGISTGPGYIFGPGSQGAFGTLGIAASIGDNLFFKTGIGQWGFGQVVGFYMQPNGLGANLFHFEDPLDEKKVQRGAAILDSWDNTNDPMGPSFRSLKVGSHQANRVRMVGAAAAGSGEPHAGYPTVYAEGEDAAIGLDFVAKGDQEASTHRFHRGDSVARVLMGRMSNLPGVNSSWLLRGRANSIELAAEGPSADYGVLLSPKGAGKVVSGGPAEFLNGTGANNPNTIGAITFEFASNTQLRVKMMGTDSVVRFAVLNLTT